MDNDDDLDLGTGFWLKYIGAAVACAIVGLILFIFIGGAWARWGFLGTFLIFAVVLLGFAWIYDRRAKRKYEALGDD